MNFINEKVKRNIFLVLYIVCSTFVIGCAVWMFLDREAQMQPYVMTGACILSLGFGMLFRNSAKAIKENEET